MATRVFSKDAVAGAQANTGKESSSESNLKLVNRLFESRSPYVRSHMNNPVAWQMWTPEAHELARKHNRVIFLSIGYAACHWCHVMERESFENHDVAALLNSSFIPIKVDREERPDVDRIYMNYVQATTGSGGWPLSVFLTPNLEPLFGGTYWPGPGSTVGSGAVGHIDFMHVLKKMADVWRTQREKCLESAREITEDLREFTQEGMISLGEGEDGEEQTLGVTLDLELLEEAYNHFVQRYDRTFAGFGDAPKFPTPSNLAFLLRLGEFPQEVRDVVGEKECEKAREMALETLSRMARGGIHDQIGNGFARYSVTRDWSLPHFEKMLYDQAQLLAVYLDAYLITKDSSHLDTVHDIATYLTSAPIHSPEGGFFSAEDADSYYRSTDKEKREGAFYVWTQKELQSILGDRDAEVVGRYYGVQENGNVSPEHDAHDELINQNVLAITTTPDALAKEFGLEKNEVLRILQEGKEKLRAHREKERPRPALDDKIVTSWNGLAIGALARVASAIETEDPERASSYLQAAKKAALFIKQNLYDEERGTAKRVFREGPGDAPGFADDYAFLIAGLCDLFEATGEEGWLEWAEKLQHTQIALFWDSRAGGFFSTSANATDLILRLKDGLDNAEPSTNGASARNLLRLASYLEDEGYEKKARETTAAFEAEVLQHPFLFVGLMEPVVAGRLGVRGVVVAGEGEKCEERWRGERDGVGVLRTVTRVRPGEGWLRGRSEVLKALDAEKNVVMICEKGTCREERIG